MKTSRLLATAALATAIGAPIAGFVGDMIVAQPITSTGGRVSFLHVSSRPLAAAERASGRGPAQGAGR
jgi:hypothetical protein